MENQKNCWEIINCPKNVRKKCPAYKYSSGLECWLLHNMKTGCVANNRSGGCMNCPIIKTD